MLTLEDRIAALEGNQKKLKERVEHVASDSQRMFSEQADKLSAEIGARERGDREQAEQLKLAHTGGLTLSVMGTT